MYFKGKIQYLYFIRQYFIEHQIILNKLGFIQIICIHATY